jgi:hypothetical protein
MVIFRLDYPCEVIYTPVLKLRARGAMAAQLTFNQLVVGSNPTVLTNYIQT